MMMTQHYAVALHACRSAEAADVVGAWIRLLQLGPLHEQVVGQAQRIEQLARERHGLHSGDALHVDHRHPLESQELRQHTHTAEEREEK